MSEIVQGFREAIQDLLVPELQSMRDDLARSADTVTALTERMAKRFEKMDQGLQAPHQDMDKRFDALDREMGDRVTKLEAQMGVVLERVGA